MTAQYLHVDDEHPLAIELNSLRTSVARYQHEAHSISVKLQRHSLETSQSLERSHALERENARLHEEIQTLRANPDLTPHPAASQVPELTLALRRLSDKLTYTEETLLSRTNELAQTHNDLAKAQSDALIAHELANHARAREEEGKARERELERRARASEEERRLADLVVQEYADLVRNLEGRQQKSTSTAPPEQSGSGASSNTTLVEALAEGKSGLQKLLGELNGETERLSLEMSRLQGENEYLKAQLEAERAIAEADRQQFTQTSMELHDYKAEDNTAAKMVSRYMKFSQSTTDSLQQAMESLRQRHAAAVATLELRIDNLHKSLQSERRQAEKLRHALDELSEDISREAFGRRREVSLRLSFLGREEGLAENLRRWIRKFKEAFERSTSYEGPDKDKYLRDMYERVMCDAEALLETLNGQPALEDGSPGSVARLLLAQDSVAALTRELQQETDRRLDAQRRLSQFELAAEALVDGAHIPELPVTPSSRHRSTASLVDVRKSTSREFFPQKLVSPVDAHPLNETGLTNSTAPDEDRNIHTTQDIPHIPLHNSQNGTQSEKDFSVPDIDSVELGKTEMDQDSVEVQTVSKSSSTENNSHPMANPEDETQKGTTSLSMPTIPEDQSSTSPVVVAPEQTVYRPTSLVPTHIPIYDLNSMPDPVRPSSVTLTSNKETPVTSSASLILPAVGNVIEFPLEVTQSHPVPETIVATSSLSSPDLKHPLLAELVKVRSRYDELQKSFRDCHLALKDLKTNITRLSLDSDSIIKVAIERLNDYNEDARVELEIRVADEERIITGYETLLSVPGAISDEVDESEMSREIRMFIDGTDPVVSRSMSQFERKLDDLQHDVASVKRALHEQTSAEDQSVPTTPTTNPQGWSSWTAGILGGSSRPVSPAPTFGSVMTSPRLRQASFSSLHKSQSRPMLRTSSSDERDNQFVTLDLRIPMPAHAAPPPSPSRGLLFSGGPGMPRARVASAPIYALGLGARSSSFGLGSSPVESPQSRFTPKIDQTVHVPAAGDDTLDSDVE